MSTRRHRISPIIVHLVVGAIDFFVVSAIGFGLFATSSGPGGGQLELWARSLFIVALAAALTSGLFEGSRRDRDDLMRVTATPAVLIQWICVVSVFVFAANLGRVAGSFLWAWAWFASAVLYLVASRLILGWAVELWQTDDRFAVGCAIIGSGALAQRLRGQQPVGVR